MGATVASNNGAAKPKLPIAKRLGPVVGAANARGRFRGRAIGSRIGAVRRSASGINRSRLNTSVGSNKGSVQSRLSFGRVQRRGQSASTPNVRRGNFNREKI